MVSLSEGKAITATLYLYFNDKNLSLYKIHLLVLEMKNAGTCDFHILHFVQRRHEKMEITLKYLGHLLFPQFLAVMNTTKFVMQKQICAIHAS